MCGSRQEKEERVLEEWAELHDRLLGFPPAWGARSSASFCSAILAHNLARELQMQAEPLPQRNTTEKRSPRWIFEEIHTLRRHLLQRAARLIRPQGRLTLVMSANAAVRDKLLHYLRPFDLAA